MTEKFNKNAKGEKFTNLLGIAIRLIVIDTLKMHGGNFYASWPIEVHSDNSVFEIFPVGWLVVYRSHFKLIYTFVSEWVLSITLPFFVLVTNKYFVDENEKCTAHGLPTASGLPTEAVGSPVDRSCLLFMKTHYNICSWVTHGQLSGQELPTNFQSLYSICPWAAQTVRFHSGQLSGQLQP